MDTESRPEPGTVVNRALSSARRIEVIAHTSVPAVFLYLCGDVRYLSTMGQKRRRTDGCAMINDTDRRLPITAEERARSRQIEIVIMFPYQGNSTIYLRFGETFEPNVQLSF